LRRAAQRLNAFFVELRASFWQLPKCKIQKTIREDVCTRAVQIRVIREIRGPQFAF